MVTLNLTINNSSSGVDVITACDSYTWIDGITYTASNNTATYTLTNAAGCDSVVTLNLTINDVVTSVDVVTSCDSYTWVDGVTYTENNNTATYTYTAANGCDSVVTLNLTINYSVHDTIYDVITSATYIWHGTAYTTPGVYHYYSTTEYGCDSLLVLVLEKDDDGGIEATGDKFRFYPNPTSGPIYFENPEIVKVEVFNMKGSIEQRYEGSSIRSIDLTDLPRGTYLLRLTLSDGTVGVERVIVKYIH